MPLMDMTTGLKECTACGQTKQNLKGEAFYKNPSAKDGYSTICKDCRKQYNKADPSYRAEAKEREAQKEAENPRSVARKMAPREVPATHTRPEIEAIAKETGLVYAGSLVVNAKSKNTFADQKGNLHSEEIDTGYSIRVPVFRKAH